MMNAIDQLWEDGIEKGVARERENSIRNMIEALREVGTLDDVIVELVANKYQLENGQMQKYM